jgi:uncharacterized protein YceK
MEYILRLIIGFTFLLSLSGCASIYTLTADPAEFEVSSEDCESDSMFIPRIYSGTAFDLYGIFTPDGGQGSAIMFYDFFLSLPVDTIVLPYTIYGQIRYGNLSRCIESNKTSNKQLKQDSVTVAPFLFQKSRHSYFAV